MKVAGIQRKESAIYAEIERRKAMIEARKAKYGK
jgi:hypothetical protein